MLRSTSLTKAVVFCLGDFRNISGNIPSYIMSAQKIIHQLDLQPHPEGGWYRRTSTSPAMLSTLQGHRPTLTSIFYLLAKNHLSRWHVIQSTELWHFYKGAPLEMDNNFDGYGLNRIH
ncbi:cupin domain-containing protein [Acidithiobacillus sulfurivorans]|uniref:Cupin domain-containing protein n=1 Tax=Acidithiobacillus sulfurivorans TaxID=1958756 RepID=A0ABS6A2Y1_9PROT|nr:cupin domain-containing protein [Acidithiobacillus sulfurivorans]